MKEVLRNNQEFRAPLRFSRSVVENLKQANVSVKKADNIYLLDLITDEPLMVTMTLCPLYEVGKLSQSCLMTHPASIQQSRVAEKWSAGVRALEVIQNTCVQKGQNIEAILTFADLGVISGNPENENALLLDYHQQVYQNAAQIDLGERLGINYSMQKYSDLVSMHPRFVSAGEQIVYMNEDQAKVEVKELLQRLAILGLKFNSNLIDLENMLIDKRAMRIIRGLMRTKDDIAEATYNINLAQGLIYQYGRFDALTTHPGALNLFIERESSGLLLQVTDLFEHSRNPRIDIIV